MSNKNKIASIEGLAKQFGPEIIEAIILSTIDYINDLRQRHNLKKISPEDVSNDIVKNLSKIGKYKYD